MNERWVCKRCFADNDDTNLACHRCGLTRGAEATQADQSGWAAQSGQPSTTLTAGPAGWQRWLRFWWIPAIVVVLAVGYFTTARRDDNGALSTAGNVGVDDLRTGDCFNSDQVEITDVDGVPCTQPHDYQVFALVTHEASTYPTDDEMGTIFDAKCTEPFAQFVGVDYASSELYGQMITPSEESWADGDRSFICVLYEPVSPTSDQNKTLTESMQDANR